MYFNDKNETNIDVEFQQDSILSKLLKLFSKYKIIIIVSILLIIGIIIIILLSNNGTSLIETTYYLDLKGNEEITIYTNSDYIEPGYDAYNSKEEDMDFEVEISSNLDTSTPGEYIITYTIGEVSKTRKIFVIEKPTEYTYIYLKTVNGSVNVYLKLGEKYVEPGYMVFSSSGKSFASEVTVTGSVDTSKKGSYKLVYSLVDSNGVTVSAIRTVIVMDSEISLSLSTNEYTNKDVTINVQVIDNYFDYMILPDKSKITKTTASYKVTENGTYTFTVYNKKGDSKEASIKVSNIDKMAPTGSCSGNFEDGVSTINVNAKDDIGIKKYVINNKEYTSSKITINSELKTADITIYDKAGNTKVVSCNLEDKNPPIISDKSITFSYKYIKGDNYMPYALYTPSTASDNKDIPLVVWLHGGGEFNSSESTFKNSGLLKVLNEWKLDGFNAYVLCPHVTGEWHVGLWVTEKTKNNLYNLIDKFIKENNVNTKKIILVGHSQGGRGTLYIAYHRPEFFSSLVVLSGFDPTVDISSLKNIPAKGYSEGYGYMRTTFVNTFGKENYMDIMTSHGNIPNMAFNLDENKDNKSDLVEWMLTQELK